MTLLYKAVQSNMASEDGKKKWYPRLFKKGTVDTMELAVEIAERSSLTPGDVYNVIQNLFSSMRLHLLNSETVRLEGLGSFTVKAHSDGNGVDDPEEVTSKQINYLTIQFTPTGKRVVGKVVRPMLSGANFERIDKKRK